MVPVVGPQFCAPYVVALTVTKKVMRLSNGDFVITDVNGSVLMKVKGNVFGLNRRKLCDADGTPIISIKQKAFSLHNRWYVYRRSSSDQSELLFTVRKSRMLQLNTEFHVFLAGNTDERHCDFRVKGSWFKRLFIFYLRDTDTVLALMRRKYELKNVVLGKDTFDVTVYPNVDYAFVVAIVVILHAIYG